MPEEERLRLQTIAERIALIKSWTDFMNEQGFYADLMARDAAALSLMLIGETARRLRDDTKAKAPDVPWQAVIALRNRIAHGYETVDHSLVWQIIQQDLPSLAAAIDRLLREA